MLTGLESIGNGQLPTGNFWTELGANLYRENKKNTGQAYMPWVRYSRLNVFGFAYAFTYM